MFSRNRLTRRPGFTLIEMILVTAVMAVLASIILIAVNPSRNLARARNANRQRDVGEIVRAIQLYIIKNGSRPAGIDATLRMIGTSVSGCDVLCPNLAVITAIGCLDLNPSLTGPFLAAIPEDPQQGSPEKTHYAIKLLPNGKLHVTACGAEVGETITAEQ